MSHKPTIRIVPGADTAVLFLHGILGTPRHFQKILPLESLVPEEWSVCNILLDGHGKGVEDFSHSSMKKWKEQVWEVFSELSRSHERVILVAHSMGTLFSIQLAVDYPDRIPFLFLLAVPLRPWVRWFGIVNMMRMPFGLIREDHPIEAATKAVCGVGTTKKLWKYLGWIPRFLELFAEIYRTEQVLGKVKVSCVAYQSKRDELVMNLTRRILEKSGKVKIRDLPDSTHFYYAPEDKKRIIQDFEMMIEDAKNHA